MIDVLLTLEIDSETQTAVARLVDDNGIFHESSRQLSTTGHKATDDTIIEQSVTLDAIVMPRPTSFKKEEYGIVIPQAGESFTLRYPLDELALELVDD